MGKRLMFDDIDEWTPSSISIVDEPFHPLCHFEVYEDDDEYVKKSIEINDGEIMVNEQPEEKEQMVSGPASFFKEIFGKNVAKSEEVPPAQKKEEEPEEESEILKLLRSFDERLKKLEEKEKPTEPVKDAVVKSEGESEEASEEESEEEETTETEETEETVDEEEVVTKSIDPDLARSEMSTSEKSFCERMGRNENGMTW